MLVQNLEGFQRRLVLTTDVLISEAVAAKTFACVRIRWLTAVL